MFEMVERSHVRGVNFRQLLDDLRQDLHYAARQLRRAPGFSALVIATLAIGIGANATMVGVIDRLLFRAPPELRNADQLTRLVFTRTSASGVTRTGASVDYSTFLTFKQGVTGLSDVAGAMRSRSLSLVSSDPSAEVKTSLVTANYFETLGVRAALGSFFGSNDGFPTTARMGGPALAVISYGLWHREFGGRRELLGQPIRVGKLSYTIVGVAPPAFRGFDDDAADVWVPITVALEVELPMRYIAAHDGPYMQMVGRMRTRASRERVQSEGTAIIRAIQAQIGERDESRVVAAPIAKGRGPDAPREMKITLWLGGVSALVLLIVCANVANLLLGRSFTRRREIAVRLALGAGRARLARQLLAEGLLLSAIAGALGLLLAAIGGRFLQQLLVADLNAASPVDVRLLLFTLVVTLGTGVVVSLVPMLQGTTPDISNGLRANTSGFSGRGISVRSVLLTAQAALCVILLVGAGLFAQSLRRVQQLDLGVDLDRTLQVSLFGANQLQLSRMETLALIEQIRSRVRALPGVLSVALAQAVFQGGNAVDIHRPGERDRQVIDHSKTDQVSYRVSIDSGMFRTLGTRSLRGRDFGVEDRAGAPLVTILNEPLATLVFRGEDPIGQCVILPLRSGDSGPCVRVVGVLGGFNRNGILTRDAMVAYIPLAQDQRQPVASMLYVQAAGEARALTEAVRRAIQTVRPDLRQLVIQSMREVIEPEMRPWNLAASVFVLFGAVALIIASIGMYAVVSFSVAQRTNEIAVRLALGARTHHISRAVGVGSLYAVLAGLGIGVIITMLAHRSIGPLLFQTSPGDPLIIGAVAVLLLAVAIVAMVVPLLRALRVSPGEVLRAA